MKRIRSFISLNGKLKNINDFSEFVDTLPARIKRANNP